MSKDGTRNWLEKDRPYGTRILYPLCLSILINNRILKTSFVSRLRICELRQGFMDFVWKAGFLYSNCKEKVKYW
jgi:hypothetical protein